MPFYSRVNDAQSRASSALSQLYSYNHDPRYGPMSEPNRRIRESARLTLDPTTWGLQQAAQEGYYERVPEYRIRDAVRAAELIRRATWDLSHNAWWPDRQQYVPANVYSAQYNIREAVDLLRRANW